MIPAESRPTCYAFAVEYTEGSQIRVVHHVLLIYAILLINSKRYNKKERTPSPSTQKIILNAPTSCIQILKMKQTHGITTVLKTSLAINYGPQDSVTERRLLLMFDFGLIKAFLRHLTFS
jgi:hypothetical protein